MEFIDNQDCLDCLEGAPDAPNLAVFPLIDEACRLPRATYQVRLLACRPSTAVWHAAAGSWMVGMLAFTL